MFVAIRLSIYNILRFTIKLAAGRFSVINAKMTVKINNA